MKWGEVLDSSTKIPSPCYLNLRLTFDLQACSLSLPVKLFNKKPLCIDILLILICAPPSRSGRLRLWCLAFITAPTV